MSSTAKAGRLQAGDAIDKPAADLIGVLDSIISTKAGVAALDALNAQLADAEAAAEKHAAGAEAAQLRGEEAEQAHTEETGVLSRRIARVRVAIDRATERLAVVAEQERRAAGEQSAARALDLAKKAEVAAMRYTDLARSVAVALDEFASLSTELIRERAIARDAGVACEALLPHESRFQSEITEEREVITPPARIGVFDVHGNPVGHGGGRHFGTSARDLEPQPTRRRERFVVQHRHAPANILGARAVLPSVDGGNLLDRNA